MEWLKKHDVITKALSFLVALVLWLYVVNVTDLSKNYTIHDIAPEFIGTDEIMTSKNLMVVGKYSVDIEVSGSRQDIISLNKSDVKVEVDVSKITSAGTYELPYTVSLPSSAYTVRSKNPQKLSVKFDEEDVKIVPVKLNTDAIAAEGYVVDQSNVMVVPKELKLSGLQEDVEKIACAEAIPSQKDLKTTLSEKVSYIFYDFDGKVIKKTSATADYSQVDITVPVLMTKKLPLSIDVQGSDAFKKYVFYTFEPKEILVAGEESIISQMSSIPAGSVKISEITSGMNKKFTLTMPDKILNLSGETEANAKIEFDGLSKKNIKTTLIEVINTQSLPSGYKVRPVTTSLDVSILGTDEILQKVNSSNVRAVADLQTTVLSRGTHPVNVSIIVDGVEETAVSGADNYVIYVEVK